MDGNNLNFTEEQSLEHSIARIGNSGKDLYLYGAGATADIVLNKTKDIVPVKAIIVDDQYYKESMHHGIEVIKTSDYLLSHTGMGDYVWICIDNLEERQRIRKLLAPRSIMTSSFPIEAYRTDRYLDYDFFAAHKPDFQVTYGLLADDISKDTMEHYLYACVSGDISLLNGDPKPHQYFNDITKKCDCSIFVDCGAFVGDTVMEALNFYGLDKIIRVYSFEPDETNVQKILENVKSGAIPQEKFTLIRAGCSDAHATLAFSSNGDGSSICEDGDITIDVDSIDNVIKGPVTFIKMDIEGCEHDAIRGATRTIKKDRPTLCICVYHKREDLITIPKLIMSIAGDGAYRFYLRHHQTNLTELVLYAIPR